MQQNTHTFLYCPMLQRDAVLKNSGLQRDVTDNGHKKETRVENSKAAKCKIVGDAYRMSCRHYYRYYQRLPRLYVH